VKKFSKGFWNVVLQRAHEHIQPSYVARGFVPNPHILNTPYHMHPRFLVSNEGEPPCMPEPERVDVSWLVKHGIPRPGHMIVLRLNNVQEPFCVGVVDSVRGLTDAAAAEVALVQLAEAERESRAAAAEAATAVKAAAAAAAAAAALPAAASVSAASALPLRRGGNKVAKASQGLRNAALTLKQFEVKVVYWDIHPDQFSSHTHLTIHSSSRKVKAKAAQFWDELCARNNTQLEALQQALEEAVAADRPPPPSLGFVVDVHKGVTYIPPAQRRIEATNSETITGASAIIWGPPHELFCGGKDWAEAPEKVGRKLRAASWLLVRQDLTEQFQPHAEPAPELELALPAAAAASAAAVAAAAAPVPSRAATKGMPRARINRKSSINYGLGLEEVEEQDDEQWSGADEDSASESDSSLTRSRKGKNKRTARSKATPAAAAQSRQPLARSSGSGEQQPSRSMRSRAAAVHLS
jgi:hypothetical protein